MLEKSWKIIKRGFTFAYVYSAGLPTKPVIVFSLLKKEIIINNIVVYITKYKLFQFGKYKLVGWTYSCFISHLYMLLRKNLVMN